MIALKILIIVVLYVLGVIASLAFTAWVNSPDEDGTVRRDPIPNIVSVLSWAYLLSFILAGIICFGVEKGWKYTGEKLYKWFYNKFDKK